MESIANPLTEALYILTGVEPPEYTHGLYDTAPLGDRVSELQDWCADNARLHWMTGLSVIEAAELIVSGAVENGNIL